MDILKSISDFAIPLLIALIPLYAIAVKKVPVYEEFVEGAKEGFNVAVKIIPYLVAMLVAIGMFRASGAMDLMIDALAGPLEFVGIPPEILPLAIMRPLSGSGSIAILGDLVNTHGPDSLIAKISATILGSTETTFYVIAVYFGSVGIKKFRHSIFTGLFADLVGIIASVFICKAIFT